MVHLRSILAIVRKDALELWLDKAKLAGLVFPLVLALLWFAITRLTAAPPASTSTSLLVYNPGQSPLQQTVSGLFPSATVTRASSPEQVSAAFAADGTSTSATYDVGLVIPAGFEASLKASSRPQVNLYLNSTAVSSQQAAFLQAAISYYARTIATPESPVSLLTSTIHPAARPTAAKLAVGGYYANLVLPISLQASLALLPALIIEEKEKKTLRMLMVSPASFVDVLLGKVVVIFIYQVPLSLIMLALFGAFTGNVPLLLLFVFCAIALALAVGLILGTMLETSGSAGGIEAAAIFAFLIPAIFLPLAPYMNSSAVAQIIRFFPTYYVADGVYNALQKQGTFSSNVADVGITLGLALVIFVGTVWLLRRQAQVAASI